MKTSIVLLASVCVLAAAGLAWAGERKFGHSYGGPVTYHEQEVVRWQGVPPPYGYDVIVIAPPSGSGLVPVGDSSREGTLVSDLAHSRSGGDKELRK